MLCEKLLCIEKSHLETVTQKNWNPRRSNSILRPIILFFDWKLYSNSRTCINFHVKQPLEIPFRFYIFLSEGTFERQKIRRSKSSAGPSIRLKILTDMILYENHIFKMVNLRMTLNSVSIVMFRSCLFMVGVGECNNIGVKSMEHRLGICLFFRFR